MFTSRAEYRILLRQDNADERLTERGFQLGIASSERQQQWITKKQTCADFIEFMRHTTIPMKQIDGWLESIGSTALREGSKISDIILRPQVTIMTLAEVIPELKQYIDNIEYNRDEIVESCEIQIKYEGYIRREKLEAQKLQRLDQIRIPSTKRETG